jgi:DNA-binding transcriptional MocR family regulator
VWLPLSEEARADQIAMALLQEQVSVSTAEPFATSVHVPHAIRLALGSVDMHTLRQALMKVTQVVGAYS